MMQKMILNNTNSTRFRGTTSMNRLPFFIHIQHGFYISFWNNRSFSCSTILLVNPDDGKNLDDVNEVLKKYKNNFDGLEDYYMAKEDSMLRQHVREIASGSLDEVPLEELYQ